MLFGIIFSCRYLVFLFGMVMFLLFFIFLFWEVFDIKGVVRIGDVLVGFEVVGVELVVVEGWVIIGIFFEGLFDGIELIISCFFLLMGMEDNGFVVDGSGLGG